MELLLNFKHADHRKDLESHALFAPVKWQARRSIFCHGLIITVIDSFSRISVPFA
jgi:hypothetical protein